MPATWITRSLQVLLFLSSSMDVYSEDTHLPEGTLPASGIRFQDLEKVDLRYYQGIHCEGSQCPLFNSCSSHVPATSTSVAACWNSESLDLTDTATVSPLNHKETGRIFDRVTGEILYGQVYELRNVFIDNKGVVFDQKHVYTNTRLCSHIYEFEGYRPNETVVKQFDELASITSWLCSNFYHMLLECLPSLLLLKPFLDRNQNLTVAMASTQVKYTPMFSLLGLSPTQLHSHGISHEILFARRLLLPAQATCSRPSKSLVKKMRKTIMAVHPRKVPILGPLGPIPNQNEDSEGWVVIIGIRTKTRQIEGWLDLRESLMNILPRNQTVEFDGNLGMEKSQELFSRCLFFITPHGALMGNIVFMPSNSEVLEIRQTGYDNKVFHYLAQLCDVGYNLVHGHGTRDTNITVDHGLVINTVREIMQRFRRFFVYQ